MEFRKLLLLSGLTALVFSTIAAGLYFEHYFVVSVFGVWFVVECLLWRFSSLLQGSKVAPAFPRLSSLLASYGTGNPESESELQSKIAEIKLMGKADDKENRWLDRLKDLSELRELAFGSSARGKKALKQGLIFMEKPPQDRELLSLPTDISIQDLMESAMRVSDLYWKLYETCLGQFEDLAPLARELFEQIFGVSFGQEERFRVEHVTDTMVRNHGAPFLALNLIRQGRLENARTLTRQLLSDDTALDEEVRSAIYWITEVYWFSRRKEEPIEDFETSIRYLYHLCFTNPERAGFLEIDSQFFSQFENVSELAREGFLFKETLVERVLELWVDYEGLYDPTFHQMMETFTGEPRKIYQTREGWEDFWAREQEDFGREYLFVVEGNLCFAQGHIEDAQKFYEQAIEINPELRSALFNSLFCYAKLKDTEKHEARIQSLLSKESLFPAALYVIGNSYLLMGNSEKSDAYFEELKEIDEWKLKADYYRSTFCFEHGLFEPALEYARRAYQANPSDSSVSYHLSLCYSTDFNDRNTTR